MPYHHGDLRRAIVAAARRRLAEAPHEPLSIRALARTVGVSPNAPYRHFADRDALLRAVAADGYRVAASKLTGRTGPAAVAPVWEGIVEKEPALVELMTALASGAAADPELQAAIAEWLGEVIRVIEGDVAGDDPGAVVERAVACWAAVHGLTDLRRSGALKVIDDWLLPPANQMAIRSVRG